MGMLDFLPKDHPLVQAAVRSELARREEQYAAARRVESSTSHLEANRRLREATRSTAHWMRHHTRTFNPHWVEEGLERPDMPFPNWYFLEPVTEIIEREPVCVIEKSRDMMASWLVVAYFLIQAMTIPDREIVFQSIAQAEAEQLIDYAKTMYRHQEEFLRDAYPLSKAIEKQPAESLGFANGSSIWAIAKGKDKIRSYHPWGYMGDEAAFQEEGLMCLDNAINSGVQKVVLVSSANVGWLADYKNDVNL